MSHQYASSVATHTVADFAIAVVVSTLAGVLSLVGALAIWAAVRSSGAASFLTDGAVYVPLFSAPIIFLPTALGALLAKLSGVDLLRPRWSSGLLVLAATIGAGAMSEIYANGELDILAIIVGALLGLVVAGTFLVVLKVLPRTGGVSILPPRE